MNSRDYLDYLQDILDSIRYVKEFVAGMDFKNFLNDRKTTFAVVKCIENIGEAVKNIPDSIRNKYMEIPWKEIAGMRDKLSHAYFKIDIDVLWKTIQKDIPQLEVFISKVIGELKDE